MNLEMGILMLFLLTLWGTKLPRDIVGVGSTNTTVCMLTMLYLLWWIVIWLVSLLMWIRLKKVLFFHMEHYQKCMETFTKYISFYNNRCYVNTSSIQYISAAKNLLLQSFALYIGNTIPAGPKKVSHINFCNCVYIYYYRQNDNTI